jgi:hypothetical protein
MSRRVARPSALEPGEEQPAVIAAAALGLLADVMRLQHLAPALTTSSRAGSCPAVKLTTTSRRLPVLVGAVSDTRERDAI